MGDFFTDPVNVPLSQWLMAGSGLLVALITVLAFLRSRRSNGASVLAKNHSIAAGRDVTTGDVSHGDRSPKKD